MDRIEPAAAGSALLFATPGAWIEGDAVRQLEQAAEREGAAAVAGFPDLHPGRYGPVGCALLSQDVLHPDLVGTDIGCGMSLHALDLPARKVKPQKAADRLASLGDDWREEADAAAAGRFGLHASALGTLGGGNHFCELQAVHGILDPEAASAAGLGEGQALLLVHTGSRSLGAAAFARHWNGTQRGLQGAEAEAYMKDHDEAVAFAALNRSLVAARAADALRAQSGLLADVPHNLVERTQEGYLHRKGAAAADRGLVPVPGSRGSLTYLVQPLGGDPRALSSLAHGAGRKHDRRWMEAKAKGDRASRDRFLRNPLGGRVVCGDGRLEVEESHAAYKDIEAVIADLEAFGLARTVAVTRPLVTYKSSGKAVR